MYNMKKHIAITSVVIIVIAWGFSQFSSVQYGNGNVHVADFITIGTVFSGFLFSVLGILLSLTNTTIVKRLNGTPFVYNQCMYIAEDILYFMISVILNLVLLVFPFNEGHRLRTVILVAGMEEMLLGVGYFMYVLYWMLILVRTVLEVDIEKGQKIVDNYERAVKEMEKRTRGANDGEFFDL